MLVSKDAKLKLMETLKTDLLRQYDAPLEMDYSIYANDVLFTDPMTTLPKSRLLYKGMIATIAVIIKLFFRPGSATFELERCELVDGDAEHPDGRIVTRFRTSGTTRWASPSTPPFVISGEDSFWIVERSGMPIISHHESMWDQTPEDVIEAFKRRAH